MPATNPTAVKAQSNRLTGRNLLRGDRFIDPQSGAPRKRCTASVARGARRGPAGASTLAVLEVC
jgi:hypothetical protein